MKRLVPEAGVAVAHGQMPEAELEKAMLAFVEGRANVLVATTIIENGLDIPRANTLLVNRADRYGLAQLYQLRGRVGRSDRRAYAYLLVPPDTVLSEIARKRLAAIREFSDLGAGFRIAALDLELRGAGNLLGGEQSGHIQAVGLDLYVKLLEQTILELKGEAPVEALRASLNLRARPAHPRRLRPRRAPADGPLQAALPGAERGRGQAALREEIRDRYGAPPARGRATSSPTPRCGSARRPWASSRWTSREAGPSRSASAPLPPSRPRPWWPWSADLPGAAVRPTGLRAPLPGGRWTPSPASAVDPRAASRPRPAAAL